MLKREIKYEDFDGEEITEIFYFHISKPELVKLEVEYKSGMQAIIREISKTQDNKRMIELFDRIILMAYGEKSDDGKRFVKSPELIDQFKNSAAYHQLFMEMLEDDKVAADFLIGALPKDMTEAVRQALAPQDKPQGPPPPKVTS